MKKIFIIVFAFLMSACGFDASQELSEQQVVNYIRTYKQLRSDVPEMTNELKRDSGNDVKNINLYNKMNDIMQKGGFVDYADFVMVNAKIVAIMSVLQAEKGMGDQQKLNQDSEAMLDDGLEQIKAILNDPQIPEEVKAEQQKLLAELESEKKEWSRKSDENSGLANVVLDKVNEVSTSLVTENDLKLVAKYEDEIMEVYLGF